MVQLYVNIFLSLGIIFAGINGIQKRKQLKELRDRITLLEEKVYESKEGSN